MANEEHTSKPSNLRVAITTLTFNDETTGNVVPYERLVISNVLGGEVQSLQLKLSKSELLLAKLLLNSTEQLPEARPATEAEQAFFRDTNNDSDTIDLTED